MKANVNFSKKKGWPPMALIKKIYEDKKFGLTLYQGFLKGGGGKKFKIFGNKLILDILELKMKSK